ncbi:type II toxin-antitoxin system HicB family antitoxin [Candidatus Peregrinibacteria bacterium]|nr:type II toxin-antitoxin system HicB family antitoxin [Candidatus Peregrinibacteria bacterium]
MPNRKSKIYSFPVIIEKDEDGLFVGTVPALRNCYTQAKTMAKLYERLDEAVALCLEVENDFFKSKIGQNEFLGVQKLEFSVR